MMILRYIATLIFSTSLQLNSFKTTSVAFYSYKTYNMSNFRPYAGLHANPKGPGDARPTAMQVLQDEKLVGALSNLTVLITGATGGIGAATAKAIYETGARTFITARSLSKGQKLVQEIAGDNKDNRLELIILDLTSLDSVRSAAESFLAKSNQLNILINNAGLSTGSHQKDPHGIELQFSTNHLSHFLLFMLLKPTLLASATPALPSRVVSVASVSHRYVPAIHLDDLSLDHTPDTAQTVYGYAHSKLANIHFANALERRFGGRGLHAFSLQPGGVATELFGAWMDEATIAAAYGTGDRARFAKSAEQGAATTVWAAVGKALEGKGGLYLEDLAVAHEVDAPKEEWAQWWVPGYAPWAYDEAAEERLWKESARLVGVEE
jgi:NAD(P)-dependent dehydrogenase (short-subunit alcohol dehydrogenase family)